MVPKPIPTFPFSWLWLRPRPISQGLSSQPPKWPPSLHGHPPPGTGPPWRKLHPTLSRGGHQLLTSHPETSVAWPRGSACSGPIPSLALALPKVYSTRHLKHAHKFSPPYLYLTLPITWAKVMFSILPPQLPLFSSLKVPVNISTCNLKITRSINSSIISARMNLPLFYDSFVGILYSFTIS